MLLFSAPGSICSKVINHKQNIIIMAQITKTLSDLFLFRIRKHDEAKATFSNATLSFGHDAESATYEMHVTSGNKEDGSYRDLWILMYNNEFQQLANSILNRLEGEMSFINTCYYEGDDEEGDYDDEYILFFEQYDNSLNIDFFSGKSGIEEYYMAFKFNEEELSKLDIVLKELLASM